MKKDSPEKDAARARKKQSRAEADLMLAISFWSAVSVVLLCALIIAGILYGLETGMIHP